MPLQGKLRFATKVIITAISLVGITAGYFFITRPTEEDDAGVQVVTVDNTLTASIGHAQREGMAIETLAGRDSNRQLNIRRENKQRSENISHHETSAGRAIRRTQGATIKKMSQTSEMTKTNDLKAKNLNLSKDAKSIDLGTKKSHVKNDPIAGLLARLKKGADY